MGDDRSRVRCARASAANVGNRIHCLCLSAFPAPTSLRFAFLKGAAPSAPGSRSAPARYKMAAMLRLGSRGSLSPPTSPSRVRTIRRPTSSAAPRPSVQGESAAAGQNAWQPGDPIRFAEGRTTPREAGPDKVGGASGQGGADVRPAEWKLGDAIRFGTGGTGKTSPYKARGSAASRDPGLSPVKKQSRTR